jgi:hypothetical protein
MNGSSRLRHDGLMVARLSLDAILLEQAAHRGSTHRDATLLLNQLTELLKCGSRMESDERSQVVSRDLLIEWERLLR